MLPAVRLDNQPLLQACEIDDVVIDDQLPLELVRLEPFGPKDLPQPIFRFGRRAPHRLRTVTE
jgi:hypothetical protein